MVKDQTEISLLPLQIIIMYINNNFGNQRNLQESLEQDIQSLNAHFSRWKTTVSQLPHSSCLPPLQGLPEINYKLDCIHQIIRQFIIDFQKVVVSLSQRVDQYKGGDNGRSIQGNYQANEEQKFQLVNQKIDMLESNLRKTQQSEKRLVETLDYMMRKYEDIQLQNKTRNEDYFNTTIAQSEKNYSPFRGFKGCGGNTSAQHISHSKEKVLVPFPKQEHQQVNSLKEASFNLDYSTQSNSSGLKNKDQLRVFSQPEQKLSLRGMGPRYPVNEESKRSQLARECENRFSRNVSLNRHEHRLKFMMSNLGH